MKKKTSSVFELPPKCPALADKITGIFGWRHTYRVSQKQKGIPHCHQYLHKTYSLNLPRKTVRMVESRVENLYNKGIITIIDEFNSVQQIQQIFELFSRYVVVKTDDNQIYTAFFKFLVISPCNEVSGFS